MGAAYGLIGYPLKHSFSPDYFREKFRREHNDASYDAFELERISEFPRFLTAHPGLNGLNVTIPYKETIIPFLDVLTPEAAAIGAVNCIDTRGDKCTGYNTDAPAFLKSLQPLLQPHQRNALVLGSGGAAKAVKYVLEQQQIGMRTVSRKAGPGMIGYETLDRATLAAHTLIINTTPLGMFPDTETCPALPYQYLTDEHLLYDLIYNPAETRFLELGRKQGARTKNGLEMLRLQAELSWQIWNS